MRQSRLISNCLLNRGNAIGSILVTKLYIPPLQPKAVLRPQLTKHLNECKRRKLTLVSASAGYGKTTLISEWVANCKQPVAWLSLDQEHKDAGSFLTYFIAALQTIFKDIGHSLLATLQSPQHPSTDFILTNLLNELTDIPEAFILVLDDYHVIESESVDNILTFFLENMPPQMHLVIATREDPHLPLALLRGRGQLTELRAADLRFSHSEAGEFLTRMLGFELSADKISLLSTRTEGWITGLQLAAISLREHKNTSAFIESFTGSHYFVLDYLIEEVLKQQSESIQSFLLYTSILDRMCGSLCDTVLGSPTGTGQKTLEYLEHTNLFIIPLDSERCWYRYHHLFSELLKQRLLQKSAPLAGGLGVAELHIAASEWYEKNDLHIEAFHHAVLANDIDRSLRLVQGNGMPLYFRGAVGSVLNWLRTLPGSVMDKKPLLWITYASVSLGSGEISGVEQKLKAAEAALETAVQNKMTRDMTGQIASMRAIVGVTQYNPEIIKTQSLRALKYLSSENLSSRTTSKWTLGQAHLLLKEYSAAKEAYNEAISIGKTSGNVLFSLLARADLGSLQEWDNQLHSAADTYLQILTMVGDQPLPVLCDVHLGLARIFYQWNDMESAIQYADSSIELARLFENTIDRFITCEIFRSHLKLVAGNRDEAASQLAGIARSIQQNNYVHRIPELAAQQVVTLITQGRLEAAAQVAEKHALPIHAAQVFLARGDTSSALKKLEAFQAGTDTASWNQEQLKAMLLQAIAIFEQGEKDRAVRLMDKVLTMTEPEGFVRIFVDQGIPMCRLLSETAVRGIMPRYINRLITAFKAEKQENEEIQGLIDPLSQREIEVLELIAQGFSNHEIGEKLFLALDTVKGHNRRIFSKLEVKNRTMAIAKARSLTILKPE